MVITSMVLLKLQGTLTRALPDTDAPNGSSSAAAPGPDGPGTSAIEPPWFKEGLERSLQSQVRQKVSGSSD